MIEAMRRFALYGLGLLLASALALTYATSSRAKSGGPVSHTCSVTDRAFINGAKTNVDAVDLWGQQYLDQTSAIIAAPLGRGRVMLFGPEIAWRAQPHGTFRFLFNGIYAGALH